MKFQFQDHVSLQNQTEGKQPEEEEDIMEEIVEEYDCPIHGKLGGINYCPRC
jgi:hypothetical protein